MNRMILDRLERRMGEDSRRRRSSRTGRYMSDRSMDRRDYEDERDYEDRRRGRDYEDERDYRRGRRDYEDERDYDDRIELSKADMHEWKRKMVNADGSKGAHYDMQQVMPLADKLGIRFNEYDEKEFCLAVNIMYSDYCSVANKYVPHEKALMFYGEMAKAWLEDEDGPEPSEKLAMYYHCIVCGG